MWYVVVYLDSYHVASSVYRVCYSSSSYYQRSASKQHRDEGHVYTYACGLLNWQRCRGTRFVSKGVGTSLRVWGPSQAISYHATTFSTSIEPILVGLILHKSLIKCITTCIQLMIHLAININTAAVYAAYYQ